MPEQPRSLLTLCVRVLASQLLHGPPPAVAEVPEPELVFAIWEEYDRQLQHHPSLKGESGLGALLAFTPVWHPQRLTLGLHLQVPALGLSQLATFGSSLVHLELCVPELLDLSWTTGLPQLQCLSLRGCSLLPGAALEALQPLAQLRALDLVGLPRIDDDAALHLALLPHLEALHLGETQAGDSVVEALTYGRRLAAWAGATGEPLTPEQQRWPRSRLRRLHLGRTRVTAASLSHLMALPDLQFLDLRGCGIWRSALIPLQQHLGLVTLQGALLSASNTLAAPFLVHDAVECCCTTKGDSTPLGHRPADAGVGWNSAGST
ncbi:hypothetical protein WJX72_001334 [[Myrmecia] bisecta]|uniref:Uncharacterized protein n=1 Tax=[Myrmecia] bisecta TaxID=41462 RepID=A0AAW1QP88_9CHLO